MLAFALPGVFIFVAPHALAATGEKLVDRPNKPLIVGKPAVPQLNHQELPAVTVSTVACAPPAKEIAAPAKIVAGMLQRESAPSDTPGAEIGSSDDKHVDAPVLEDGPNQYLVRDKLELSLETPSPKADAPQSCKPE